MMMWMAIALCNAVAFCAASILLFRASRRNARLRALLCELQDTFPEFSRCPRCGALVRMTGSPCKVGMCPCGYAVLESEAEWVDPCMDWYGDWCMSRAREALEESEKNASH